MTPKKMRMKPITDHVTVNLMVMCSGCGNWLCIEQQYQSAAGDTQSFEVLRVKKHKCKKE